MNWLRRYREWLIALRVAKRTAGRLPWLTMARSILSGVVPKRVWRERIRTCRTCPLFNQELYTCRGTVRPWNQYGCDCYIPFEALTAEPYEGGCYGRATFTNGVGWPAYHESLWKRLLSPVRFLLGK